MFLEEYGMIAPKKGVVCMFAVVAAAYELAVQLGPFMLAMAVLRRRKGRYSSPTTKWHILALTVFALYVAAVFRVTGAGTLYEAVDWKNVPVSYRLERINLIPFSRDIDWIGYLLNILMLMPFGFLLPLIWQDMGRLCKVVPAGFFFSLLLELSQLLNIRGTDVDDLIMNTLGALAGFVCYLIFDKVTRSRFQMHNEDARELPIYVLAMYLGRCLLLNYLGLIELWYGY